jgi:pyrroloquinoline quinone biosynthesis protein E
MKANPRDPISGEMLRLDRIQKTLGDPQEFLRQVHELALIGSKGITPYPDPAQFLATTYPGFLRYPERLENFNLAKLETRSAARKSKPYVVDFEPVSRCNYRCTMCQVSEWPGGKRAEDMQLSHLAHMQDLWVNVVELKLHGMGEPLLHPQFFAMLRFFSDWSIWTRTSTNGSLLFKSEIRDSILQSPLGEMQISIDGATSDVYEAIRVRGKFLQVCDGTRKLNHDLDSAKRLLTRMWVVLQKANSHQLRQFADLAIDLGFQRLTFSLSLNDWGQAAWRDINSNKAIESRLIQESILRLREELISQGLEISVWRQSEHYSTKDVNHLCPWIFDRTYICSDLRITPCSIIGNPEVVDLGNAGEFDETWNGHRYRDFRAMHLEGDIPSECKSCYGENPLNQQVFVNLPVVPALSLGQTT